MPVPKSTGSAWPKLAEKIDLLVADVMAKEKLPGLSIAVSLKGRLIASLAYGHALVDGNRRLPLKPCSRLLIGSTTKATVTGSSAYQLMKSQNIDPKTTKLYGPKGLFGGVFDDDIDIGVAAAIKAMKPNANVLKSWYQKITIQHLADHHAGFGGMPDLEDAAAAFGVPLANVTIDHHHAYTLRTSTLRFEPGNPPAVPQCHEDLYSNHGFGVFALVIAKLSGKPYRNYVRGHFLKPLELHNAVRWQRKDTDSCDAYGHTMDENQVLSKNDFADSTPSSMMGLAAGGFMASATSLVKIMVDLNKKYTPEALDSMGWCNNGRGKLSHRGKVSGGASAVVMLPKGYRSSVGNLDVGEINVAVVTNANRVGALDDLANNIAVAVPPSEIAANFDLWNQQKCTCEYVRRSVPADAYQEVFDEAERSDYRLEWIEGHTIGGKLHFNVIFRSPSSPVLWASNHNLTGATYQQTFDQRKKEGFFLTHVDSYLDGNNVRYAAIWAKGAGDVSAYHGVTQEAHQKSFDTLTGEGWKPKVISIVSLGGKLQYTALYTKQAIGVFEAKSVIPAAEYQAKFDQNKAAGRHLYYLNSFVHAGKLHFSAIWAQKPGGNASIGRHGMTASEFLPIWEDNVISNEFATRALTAWEEGGKAKYAAFWLK